MKTLKLLLFLVSALVVTAFNSIASTPANDAGVINIADSRDVTIVCPECGGIDWYLNGYWVGDLFIGTSLECINCGYVEPLQ